MTRRPGEYTDEEDVEVITATRLKVPYAVTGEKLGRTEKSIAQRVHFLRREGKIPRYDAFRSAAIEGQAVAGAPGITLHNDDRLVRACLAQGGFPRAERFRGATYWLTDDDRPWQHIASPKQQKRNSVADVERCGA